MSEEVRDMRVTFAKRRSPSVVLGLTAPQLGFMLAAGVCVVMFVRSISAGIQWWWLAPASVLLLAGFVRVLGRPLADLGPSLVVNGLLSRLHLREYRGGPHRVRPGDSEATRSAQPRLPGPLSSLEVVGFRFSGSADPSIGEVGAVFDRSDGSVTVVLAVTTEGFPLMDSGQANAHVAAFGRMLDGIASLPNSPIVAIQTLNRVIPDLGEEATREWVRRGRRGSEFSRNANERLLESQVGRGIRHESYVAVRVDPSRDRSSVREFGGGDEGRAAVAFRAATRIRMELASAGITESGWVPPRGIAAVMRSAFDPASDAMVTRRGGGTGDSFGGDSGLPSGVAPVAAGPMSMVPTRKTLVHDGAYSRTWWISEFPHARGGVPIGFLRQLLLEVRWRHTVSTLLQPLDRRQANRRLIQTLSTQDAKREINRKMRRRTSRADQREEADLDRVEIDAVEGYGTYRLAMVVTVTAESLRLLELAAAEMESAMNNCGLEPHVWYVETDQAFFMGALPLARGLS